MSYKQIPLLAFVVLAYNVFAFTMSSSIAEAGIFFTLFSGASWAISVGDLLLIFGLVMLYIEVLKSTRTSRTAAFDHSLSMVVLVVCILEFVIVPRCGTSTFFLIMLMAAFDVLAGFQISISSARRDIEIDRVVPPT
jgi:hypothetical protein